MSGTRRTGLVGVIVTLGLLAGAFAPQVVVGLSFAARASVTPDAMQFVGNSVGTSFTLRVKNTGTAKSIGAVRVAIPTTYWTVIGCPASPATWIAVVTADSCTYLSPAGSGGNISKKHTATFKFAATTAPSVANRSGAWNVSVSTADDFSNPSLIKQAGAMGSGLTTTASSFEITDAVVAGSSATIGDPCPAANRQGPAGATGDVIVVCGTNHTTAAQTPKQAYSSLSGTFIATHGPFSGGNVGAGASDVVLGNWSNVTLANGLGPNHSVRGRIGAFAGRTSPLTTLTGYDLTEVAPVAHDDGGAGFTVNEDSPLSASSVLTNDTDANGDSLTAVKDTDPSHALSFTFNSNGTFSYTPSANFHGTDTFTYHANDGSLDSNIATVTITINSQNDAPVANDDTSYTTNEDQGFLQLTPGVLGNDTDVDLDTLTVLYVNSSLNWLFNYPLPVSTAQGGSLQMESSGAFGYAPPPNFHGTDTFTYLAFDGTALSNGATVTITVNSVNDPPTAADDSFSMTQNTTVAALTADGLVTDASDVDGDALTFSLVAGPSHAAASGFTLNADGSFSYQPVASYAGGDSFTWKANDGAADSNVGTMTITVNASGGGGGGGGGGCLPGYVYGSGHIFYLKVC